MCLSFVGHLVSASTADSAVVGQQKQLQTVEHV